MECGEDCGVHFARCGSETFVPGGLAYGRAAVRQLQEIFACDLPEKKKKHSEDIVVVHQENPIVKKSDLIFFFL